jgi:hypothetical protein
MHSLGYRRFGADAAFLRCQSAAVRRHDLWPVRSCVFVGAVTRFSQLRLPADRSDPVSAAAGSAARGVP